MAESRQVQGWVNEAREGDPLAVSKLLAKYHSVLRARADARMDPALRAKAEPEDILQEVYLDVFRQIDRFEDRGPDSFLNWVLTILDNELVDALRALHSQKRDIAREVGPDAICGAESYWNLLDQLYADSSTPSRVARREEAVGALLACTSRLTDPHRQVIQLRFLEGRSVDEVAKRLNKSQAVIVAMTKSALKGLRESMGRLGDFTRGL
jgi:RNA polymerase sigma-70 factor (ECF subfamily)